MFIIITQMATIVLTTHQADVTVSASNEFGCANATSSHNGIPEVLSVKNQTCFPS